MYIVMKLNLLIRGVKMFESKEEEKAYIERKIAEHGKEYWKQEIVNLIDMKLKTSGFQNGIDNETLENIIYYLMQDGKTFQCIEWLNILISWGCNLNGIKL